MSLSLKPSHTAVKAYYETLQQFGQLYIDHEGAVRSAFQSLLAKCGQRAEPRLTLVPEYRISRAKRSSVIVDGALLDLYHLPHGYWEAKDEKDDLAKEVQRKLDKGYPSDNITSMPSCSIPSTASATPPTSAASCPGFRLCRAVILRPRIRPRRGRIPTKDLCI
jgi:hypothetical protein